MTGLDLRDDADMRLNWWQAAVLGIMFFVPWWIGFVWIVLALINLT